MARNKKKLPGLNASSMSDISFLLLTFFLLVSSINTDMGIQRRLPPPSDPNVKPPDIHRRNTFVVLVNKDDKLLFNNELGDITALKDRAKEFLSNPDNLPNLPEKQTRNIPLLGDVEVSKGVISLQNDRGTSYEMYLMVQNELTAAVNELRDEMSKARFGRAYIDATQSQREAIDKAIPIAISEAEPKNIGGNK
ncbi:MAG: biopolymer transporter ExbD [Bacteroidales bacterium]|jgi:biopolymer transport protein ExbD|nr:biopolymer transporter ExbD [Bacteroidales bacterium]MEE1113172.1 biopolymer transporter ExbD [Bacteroidales bacterium]MEE1272498.1 biopolymer transporter ExbD [Bacteroidales bacterium]